MNSGHQESLSPPFLPAALSICIGHYGGGASGERGSPHQATPKHSLTSLVTLDYALSVSKRSD